MKSETTSDKVETDSPMVEHQLSNPSVVQGTFHKSDQLTGIVLHVMLFQRGGERHWSEREREETVTSLSYTHTHAGFEKSVVSNIPTSNDFHSEYGH